MKKKLIAAIVVALILLAAAIGVIVYMEREPSEDPQQTTAPEASTAEPTEESEPVETTEETVGISLPTEDPDEVTPEVTFGEEDIVPPVTGETTPMETEGPDANETPEDEF